MSCLMITICKPVSKMAGTLMLLLTKMLSSCRGRKRLAGGWLDG